jgi:RHS repeat-associated protein
LEFCGGQHFVYQGGELALSFNHAEELTDRYAWGAGGLLFDETYTAGALDDVLWAASDHLGTVRELLDENGTLVEHREYDSFGAIDAAFDEVGAAKPQNSLLTEVAYTGHWYDRNLDAYITPSRVYDPHTGRFLSEDPAGFAADGPNLYRYAKNDPVNFRDPSGRPSAEKLAPAAQLVRAKASRSAAHWPTSPGTLSPGGRTRGLRLGRS